MHGKKEWQKDQLDFQSTFKTQLKNTNCNKMKSLKHFESNICWLDASTSVCQRLTKVQPTTDPILYYLLHMITISPLNKTAST